MATTQFPLTESEDKFSNMIGKHRNDLRNVFINCN